MEEGGNARRDAPESDLVFVVLKKQIFGRSNEGQREWKRIMNQAEAGLHYSAHTNFI
jgi:hypothetical protein